VVGCLSCAWLPAVKSEREIVSAHLADLQQAAQNIERKLAQAGFEPPPASS
jgi:IclR family mhp operon transcriptional activator